MNEKIKQWAEEAGLAYKMKNGKYWIDAGEVDVHLERFAELVRDDEREACAKLCDDASLYFIDQGMNAVDGADYCANEIRGRTE
jgi:hypothetical protein